MAFGIKRQELRRWKRRVNDGEIAFLTHYWEDDRFPGCHTVTKIGCADMEKLQAWGKLYDLKSSWIHQNAFPHFDVFGQKQKEILEREQAFEQMRRFNI